MPSPSRHVKLALYVDDTAATVTSHQQALLIEYPETYLSDIEWWLREWRIAINVSKSSAMLFAKASRRIPTSSALRGPNPRGRYHPLPWDELWYTANLVESYRSGEKVAQSLGVLRLPLNRSGLSFRNGVLLYKQLICPMMDYACPVWRSAARPHIRKLQAPQSKRLRIAASEPWYTANNQIHDYFKVPFLTGNITSLTQRFDWMLADVGTP